MQDVHWDDLRFFLSVARAGSLSGAAKQLAVNHSTVLRRLGALQARLGVRLYQRLPAGYAMTAAGEALREQLTGVEQQIESAQRQVAGMDTKLSGTIRLTSTDTLIDGLLTRSLAQFRRRHPEVRLSIVVNNSFLSLTKREADLAVRPSNRPPEHLVGRRVGWIQSAIYGSEAYLRQHGRKKTWAEHDWVAPDEALAHLAQARWMRRHIPEHRIVARVDSLFGIAEAVRHGLGLGLVLCLLGDQRPGMVRLEKPAAELDTQLWILTHPDLRRVARVKALTEHLHGELARSPFVVQRRG